MRNTTFASSVILAWLMAAAVSHAGGSYVPGHGLTTMDGRLTLGGYLAGEVDFLDQESRQFSLDDLSTFITYRVNNDVRAFTEIESENTVTIDDEGIDTGAQVTSLERLYLEYEPSDDLRVRVGKLLTPIGIWNPIHAAPLVWTTERPAATDTFFDTGMTGIQIDRRIERRDLDIVPTLFAQVTDQLDKTERAQQIRRGIGGRLQVGAGEWWHAAASYLRFDDERDRRWENVVGADLLLSNEAWEVTSEFALNAPDSGTRTWSAYLQVVYHAGAGLHPVFRYEHVELEGRSRDPLLFGVAYKPLGNVVLKLEGIVGREGLGSGGNGLVTSFAVLF